MQIRNESTETSVRIRRMAVTPHAPAPICAEVATTTFARKSHRALVFLGLTGLLFLLTIADAAWLRARRAEGLAWETELVARLGLTDVCLSTEARYTRHLSQADLHSAFQDHPLGLEHFPSGSLLRPPQALMTHYANLDRKTKVPD